MVPVVVAAAGIGVGFVLARAALAGLLWLTFSSRYADGTSVSSSPAGVRTTTPASSSALTRV